MKTITLWLMNRCLKAAIKTQANEPNQIVRAAYNNLIKNYKNTIMFLEAEIESKK